MKVKKLAKEQKIQDKKGEATILEKKRLRNQYQNNFTSGFMFLARKLVSTYLPGKHKTIQLI